MARKRGNPDWIRAAEQRRQASAQVVHVVEEAEEMSEQREPGIGDAIAALCAPTLGTIAGTLIVEHLPNHLGVRREHVTAGTAVGGLLLALNSQGAVRAAAISMVAHAAAHELLKQTAVLYAAPAKDAPAPASLAVEPAYVTRADLHEAIAKMQEDQRKSIIEAVRAVMTELGPVIVAAQQRKRNAPPPRRMSPPPEFEPEHEAPDEQSWSEEEAAPTEAPSQDAEAPTPPAPPSQQPDVSMDAQGIASPTPTAIGTAQVERVQAVYSQLDEQERRLLSTLIAELPPSQANEVAAQLSTLPTDRAVDYARAVLPLAVGRRVA